MKRAGSLTAFASIAVVCATPSVVEAQDYLAMSGAQLYQRFCASCHGAQGRGDGPVAASFTVEVPDLTRIASRHGGRFPRERVETIIDGRHVIAAHGARTMPIWGVDFNRMWLGDPYAAEGTELLVSRLTDYVEHLQHRRVVPED